MPILRDILATLREQMAEEFAADLRCVQRMPRGVERANILAKRAANNLTNHLAGGGKKATCKDFLQVRSGKEV